MKRRKKQKNGFGKRVRDFSRRLVKPGICPNCGEPGPHYIPPGFGTPGRYTCEPADDTPPYIGRTRPDPDADKDI